MNQSTIEPQSPITARQPLLRVGAVSSRAFLEVNQFSSENILFTVGDTVRSYKCGFDNDKPFKNHFIEGVVISTKDKVLGDKYLVVKWQIENYFGTIYKFRMPHDVSDTFAISVSSPWLVKVNKCQLALAI
jgi:hypothetical protein